MKVIVSGTQEEAFIPARHEAFASLNLEFHGSGRLGRRLARRRRRSLRRGLLLLLGRDGDGGYVGRGIGALGVLAFQCGFQIAHTLFKIRIRLRLRLLLTLCSCLLGVRSAY